MDVLRSCTPAAPARDIWLTAEILREVAAGRRAPTLRVFQPGAAVAFGRLDELTVDFEDAVGAAHRRGFAPIVRHVGGHAVAYERESIIVEWLRPEDQLFDGGKRRFEQLTRVIGEALGQLGIALQLGELPNEYCPGRFSLHLPNGPKVVGIGQRVISGASLTAAVIAVGSGDLLRPVMDEVYRTLRLPLDISTVGAVTDRFEIDTKDVAEAIVGLAASHLDSG